MTELQNALFALQDVKFRDFQSRLIPEIDKNTVIGVRMPLLRQFARKMPPTDVAAFLSTLPHTYWEENNLHGILISAVPSYEETVPALTQFLPHVDNWATCDLIRPRTFAGHPAKLPAQLSVWLHDPHPYTVRFAMEMLMVYYLGDHFDARYPAWIKSAITEEYTVKMMAAWYFATALALRYEELLPYLTERQLDVWTHNKTIQKACESYRVPEAHKEYLRTLRTKNNSREELI